MSAALDTSALLQLVWAAPLAALTVTLAWGMVIHGSARAVDARRDGKTALSVAHLAVAVLGGALFTAALVLGFVVMTTKG